MKVYLYFVIDEGFGANEALRDKSPAGAESDRTFLSRANADEPEDGPSAAAMDEIEGVDDVGKCDPADEEPTVATSGRMEMDAKSLGVEVEDDDDEEVESPLLDM